MREENLLIIHGGGPTAVLNASLYGVIMEAKKERRLGHIYGARYGTGGILKNDLIELEKLEKEELELLLQTPGSVIGTSRDALEESEYKRMIEVLQERNIKYVLCNGGNGTMDTCGKLYKYCKDLGISVIGIPKTMDNDIAMTDHSPGYGSAALYIAQSVKEVCVDVHSLPIHVVVIEVSGRNAGWITAAAAMAEDKDGFGADFIYLPERAFVEEDFLEDMEKKLKEKSGVVVVVSEGLRDREGKPVVKPIFKTERAEYFGDVSSYLAGLIIQKLGYKARSEKPGLLGRASIGLQSPLDREEAILAGKWACQAVLQEESGKMITFQRKKQVDYKIIPKLVDIQKVMMYERKVPDEFINQRGNGVTEAFKEWCRPLFGGTLLPMLRL